MYSRALAYVLIGLAWLVFAAGVVVYQDRQPPAAGEHEASGQDHGR